MHFLYIHKKPCILVRIGCKAFLLSGHNGFISCKYKLYALPFKGAAYILFITSSGYTIWMPSSLSKGFSRKKTTMLCPAVLSQR